MVIGGDAAAAPDPRGQLQLALDAPEIIFARVAAEQKMLIVQALQKKGEIVAVTGDGVNDAPALKTADIGIAMGISGTDVAKEAADMILLDDNFASIVAAIEEGRAVFDNIRKFLTYILTSNIPELVPYLAFVLFRIPLPLTIIQILAVDLGTDMLPALALGAERPDPGVMQPPPRARAERLLSWALLARAYLFLGVLEAAGAMAGVLLRPRRSRLAIRHQPRPRRSPVSAGDLRLPRSDRSNAGGECVPVPPPAEIVTILWAVQQPVSAACPGGRDRRDPVHHLHRGRQLAVRHSSLRRRGLAAGFGLRSADVGPGRSAESMATASERGNAQFLMTIAPEQRSGCRCCRRLVECACFPECSATPASHFIYAR